MAWIRYSDTVEPYQPNSRAFGVLVVLVVLGSIGSNAYGLWRDWQHHRLNWEHLLGLLVSLSYLTILIVGGVRRGRKKNKGNHGTSKAA